VRKKPINQSRRRKKKKTKADMTNARRYAIVVIKGRLGGADVKHKRGC
jgi:hypothetical protein